MSITKETKSGLTKRIDVAAGRIPADLVIKNCKVVNVYSGTISDGDIAISDGIIAGIAPEYSGKEEIDAQGKYALPGFIDGHIHIESSYVSPEEIGRLLVPHGGTTIMADPHEIVNVCGIAGLDYMMKAAEQTKLDVIYALPSCVPSTPFENAGATVEASDMEEPISRPEVFGLGEFMNSVGVINNDDSCIDKIMVAKDAGKIVDGHCPGLAGKPLNAYATAGILADHECHTVEDMEERVANGMYVLLRQGSACHDLRTLLKGVTEANSRRCMLCSDDRQPKTIFEEGHLDDHLRICVEEGIDPITAVRMATLNAAEAFRLYDRGALAPGKRADVVLVDNLTHFGVDQVIIQGELVAAGGKYLPEVSKYSIDSVQGSVTLKDFSADRLKMNLKSDDIKAIGVLPGGVLTEKVEVHIKRDAEGDFVYDPDADVVKMAVVERHHNTGNVACALLTGYRIRSGAVAVTIAHDSHNIIAVGVSNEEIAAAVEAVREQEGGIVLVKDGQVIESMPMPIAGLMSDKSGEYVAERLTAIHDKAYAELGISSQVEPVMTLTFMSLAVIPELKLTDMGLFDVTKFSFVDAEV